MNLKDQIPAKNSKLNITDKFLRPDRASFIIDHPNIITSEQTITKGTTYALLNSRDSEIRMNMVQIIDCYYDGFVMNIIMKDMEIPQRWNIEFDPFKEQSKCTWMLVEPSFLQEEMDKISIIDYCGCRE